MLIRCQNCDFRHGQMEGFVRQRLSERKKAYKQGIGNADGRLRGR